MALFCRANPCGRLAATIPLRLEDTPAFLNFPDDGAAVAYGERLYVGHRYYDAKDMLVSYPFGHGLSYTTFAYSNLRTAVDGEGEDAVVRIRLTLTNNGPMTGKVVSGSVANCHIADEGRFPRRLAPARCLRVLLCSGTRMARAPSTRTVSLGTGLSCPL